MPAQLHDLERSIRLAMEQATRLNDHRTAGELAAILQLVERRIASAEIALQIPTPSHQPDARAQ